MLSSIALVVAGLSTGHKIGLAAVGGAFIVFALVSSFVLPRRIPNFPGRALGWYVAVCVLFFVAMLSAVLIFGVEKKEAAAATESSAQTTATATGGDATAGKAVFASAGCVNCHTLKAAGASGTVGPNLDQLKPSEARVRRQVTNGGAIMPAFKGKLSDKQISDVAAFVAASTHP
jgi:mono/diheme cytochrome c family protein